MRLYLLCLAFIILPLHLLAQDGVTGNVSFEGKKRVTNVRDGMISLMISSATARQMMVSNDPSFAGSMWEEYRRVKKWYLNTEEDGYKSVYVKFRDARGNVSEVIEAKIELDRGAPPPPNLTVNMGQKYVKKGRNYVSLEMDNIRQEDRYAMMISNRRDFLGARWERFSTKREKWILQGQDGDKTIYVKFKDKAGNESEVASGTVTLDRTPPTNGKVSINSGQRYTNNPKVKLHFSAKGAKETIFPPTLIAPPNNVVPFATEMDYTLSDGDGWKTISVKFRDEAGNMTGQVYSAKVFLDTKAPSNGFIEVNNGDHYVTRNSDINLKILAIGAKEMMVSEYADFSKATWENFANVKSSYTVSKSDGLKILHVKFRDLAGNESESTSDSIILDQTAPFNQRLEIKSDSIVLDRRSKAKILKSSNQSVDLELHADQAQYMMISNVSSFYGSKWEKYKEKYENWSLSSEMGGRKSVFVRFRDEAGNISDAASDFVLLDNQGPINCKVDIDFKREFCTDELGRVKLQITAIDADFMIISNDPTFSNADWEPFAKEKSWVLTQEDGLKTVYAKFKDLASNVTETNVQGVALSDNIILDRKPPYDCTIILNKGDETTKNIDKVVQLKVSAKEAEFMQISNTPNFDATRWIRYTNKNTYHPLTGVDGKKSVYVRFRDDAGNVSPVYQDDIVLDRTPPVRGNVTIVAAGSDESTAEKNVKLKLSAEGAVEVLISNRFGMDDAKWQPFTPSLDWSLADKDGLKTVYAKFRDEIGNESDVSYDRIGVDTEAPEQGSILVIGLDRNGHFGVRSPIDNSRFCTNLDKAVILRLSARGATDMRIGTTKDLSQSTWRNFESIIYNHYLDGEDGQKTIWVQFKDKADNKTVPISASISLDRQEPYSENVVADGGSAYTNNPNRLVELTLKAEEATEMIISNSPSFLPPARWVKYEPGAKHRLLSGDGIKKIFVKYRDSAYNESSVALAEITLDTDPPVMKKVTLNGGKAASTSNQVAMTLLAYGADQMMISNDSDFSGGFWDGYKSRVSHTLKPGEGLRTVYIKLRDNAGNEAGPFSQNITIINEE